MRAGGRGAHSIRGRVWIPFASTVVVGDDEAALERTTWGDDLGEQTVGKGRVQIAHEQKRRHLERTGPNSITSLSSVGRRRVRAVVRTTKSCTNAVGTLAGFSFSGVAAIAGGLLSSLAAASRSAVVSAASASALLFSPVSAGFSASALAASVTCETGYECKGSGAESAAAALRV